METSTYSGTFPANIPAMPLDWWQIALAWCEYQWTLWNIPVNHDPNQPQCLWVDETHYQLPLCWKGWASG